MTEKLKHRLMLRGFFTSAAFLIPCLLAAWFRYPRIAEGLPYFYREDEAHHFNRLINMVKTGDLNPHYFHKPSLHFYLRIPVAAAGFIWNVRRGHIRSVKEINTRDPFGVGGYAFSASHPGIVKWNRALSVLLSVLTVALTFLLTKELSGSISAGAIAATLAAISPSLIEDSAVIGVDVVMMFFCLLGVYLAVRLTKNFSLPLLVLTGVICGLAVSTKYNALPMVVLPVITCLAGGRFQITPLFLALVTPLLGFLSGTPYVFSSLPVFLDHLAYEVWHYGIAGHEGHQGEPGLPQAMFYLRWLNNEALGPVASAFGIVGMLLLAAGNRKANLMFIVFPLLFAALMICQRTNFTRNMLVIVPFVAVISAVAVSTISDLPGFNKATRYILNSAFLIAAGFFPFSSAFEQRKETLAMSEARLAVTDWIAVNQKPLFDTAVQGQLQFAPVIYRYRGVSRVDAEKKPPAALYLAGFERLIVSPSLGIPPAEKELLQLEASFAGINRPERIVKNPAIDIFTFKDGPALAAYLAAYIDGQAQYEYNLPLEASPGAALEWRFNPAPPSRIPSGPTEDYLWLNQRLMKLRLTGFESAPQELPPMVRAVMNVMTPWDNQEITLALPEWNYSTLIEPGKWQTIQTTLPLSVLKTQPLLVSLTQVHSPATQALSRDERRLGLAIKSLRLEPDKAFNQ